MRATARPYTPPPPTLAPGRWEQQMAKKNPFKKLADLRDDVEQANPATLGDRACNPRRPRLQP